MKKIFVLFALLLSLPIKGSIAQTKTSTSTKSENKLSIKKDLLGKEFIGYMGEYFLNNTKQYYHISVNESDHGNFYIMEGNLKTQKNFMYICDKIISQNEDTVIAECDTYMRLNPVGILYIKIIKDKLQIDDKEEDIFYVSIGNNKECIEKYNSPISFEKHCNPKTNKNISFLRLYNLHPYNPNKD